MVNLEPQSKTLDFSRVFSIFKGKTHFPILKHHLGDNFKISYALFEAIIMMVDSNCQRSNILPSEKAFSYKMKLDAIKRQGKRTDLTLSQVGKKFNAYEELARSSGDSRNQVHRYIRFTYLVPELLEFIDNGRMKMQPAVELSYLDEEAQRDIVDIIDETDVFSFFFSIGQNA